MREHWSLDPDVIHVNHGSFGAVPLVTQREQQRLRELAERNPMRWFRERAGRLAATKQRVADYLGVDPAGLALVPNASAGTTIALASIRPRPDQRLVITDHAYGAARLAVERTAARTGCRIEVVEIPPAADDDEVVRRIVGRLDSTAACLAVDQITSSTAKLMPVHRLVEAGREREMPVVVDGAHAPALIDDPVVGDFWTGNLHKWPCAPRGSGVLWVAPEFRSGVDAPTASWLEGVPYPAPFDLQGTADDTGWFAAPRSLDLLGRLGFRDRRPALSAMVTTGAQTIAEALGERVVEVSTPAPTMRVVTLPDGLAATEEEGMALQAALAHHTDVEIATPVWHGRAHLRVSAHLYNEPADYDTAAKRLAEALAGGAAELLS